MRQLRIKNGKIGRRFSSKYAKILSKFIIFFLLSKHFFWRGVTFLGKSVLSEMSPKPLIDRYPDILFKSYITIKRTFTSKVN